MNAKEFAISLKMTFEMLGTTALDARQLDVVKKNLETVFQSNASESNPFCNWLRGYFDLANPIELSVEEGLVIDQKIISSLNLNVQTPAYKVNPPGGSDGNMRC